MKRGYAVFMIVLLGTGSPAAMAQLSASERAAIEAYRLTIAAAENGTSANAVETAFTAVGAVSDVLMRGKGDQGNVLETLSEEEFQRLKRDLPGVQMTRDEIVFVEPDFQYFARLAAARGDDVDRAFFGALKATYKYSVWPVYVLPQTDYSGCTRFGSMSLVETYRIWSEFRGRYPHRYGARATKEANQVLDELTSSTCACGDAADVVQELERFRSSFPASPVRSGIDARLGALRANRSGIRANCHSG